MAKNETPKIIREIPYRFVCEHCGTMTEWKTATVSGDTNEAIDSKVIPGAMKAAQKGNYFDLGNIKGKCDRCGHRQSWELGEAKAWMRRSPVMGLGLGATIGGVGALITVFLFGLLGALIIFIALSLLGMIGAFIYGLAQYLIVKSEMRKTVYRYIPEVIWYQQQGQVEVQATLPVIDLQQSLPAPEPQAVYYPAPASALQAEYYPAPAPALQPEYYPAPEPQAAFYPAPAPAPVAQPAYYPPPAPQAVRYEVPRAY
ncbi:MAG: hypothetical protein FWF91_08550 [Coriobacteriia bacterium]|nr:hypothetical protein [Coriobacteriia bacterium]